MKYLLLPILFLIASYNLAFSAKVCYDTTVVTIKIPAEDKIKDFRDKKEFNYKADEVPSASIFVRIWDWVGRMIEKFFSNEGVAPFIRYGIIAGMVVIIVFSLMKVKIQSLFYRNKPQQSNFITPIELELLKADIDKLIDNEIQNKNYRLAIRYLYIKLLRILNNKEIISMHNSKTNEDYVMEMSSTKYKLEFNMLSNVFEYVFYGNFSVGKNTFDRVNDDFNKIFIKLNE